MIKGVATLGELMLRLKTAGKIRIRQSNIFESCYGGSEANVACSLAQFGIPTKFISALPDNDLGEQAYCFLRSYGVDISSVVKKSGRMGVYFVEEGADIRSGKVIYDRDNSTFAELNGDEIDWDKAFEGIRWFHVSGISPAISASTSDLTERALREAKKRGLHISIDLNYRAKLWQYGSEPKEVLPSMVEFADTLLAGRGDCSSCLGLRSETAEGDNSYFEMLSAEIIRQYPNIKKVVITMRTTQSSEKHSMSAHSRSKENICYSRVYELNHVVDRIGTGDAFVAAYIFGQISDLGDQQSLEFATAANALKHTIYGDVNCVSSEEVFEAMKSETLGRIQR